MQKRHDLDSLDTIYIYYIIKWLVFQSADAYYILEVK